MYANVVAWVRDAWLDIQSRRENWSFLLTDPDTAGLTESVLEYTPGGLGISDLKLWDRTSFKIYDSGVGIASQYPLQEIALDKFDRLYLTGAPADGQPSVFAIGRNDELYIGPAPNSADWVLTYRYFTEPVVLVANTDTPPMPRDLQMAIVYRAAMFHAAHEEADAEYKTMEGKFNEVMYRIDNKYGPTVEWGGTPPA